MKKILSCLLSVLLFSIISAAVPGQISFQGVLKDSAGSPVTGTRTVVFTVYGSPAGADSSWTETQTISVEAGLYNVKLGSVTPITASVFDGNTKYLGISIGGSELLPRVMMVSVPYAYRADQATYADTAGSAGGGANYVRLGPTSQQVTDETNAIWVNGFPAGVSAEGEYGIYGVGSGKAPNYGVFGKGYYGIYGINADETTSGYIGYTGVGVRGFGDYGVFGSDSDKEPTHLNLSGTYGVIGFASDTGVYGHGDVGVRGKGATAGGSFEATDASGVAVYGQVPVQPTAYPAQFVGGMGIVLPNVNFPPVPAATGTIRFNSGTGHFEGYNGAAWLNLDNP